MSRMYFMVHCMEVYRKAKNMSAVDAVSLLRQTGFYKKHEKRREWERRVEYSDKRLVDYIENFIKRSNQCRQYQKRRKKIQN